VKACGLAACLLLLLNGSATAQDPEAGLVDAQARATAAKTEVTDLEAAMGPAAAKLEAAQREAAPVRSEAERAAERVATTKASLRRTHLRAVATVKRIEEEHRDATEEREGEVRAGAGFAIAALIVAFIALAWGWFRASAAVAYLARIQLGQAIGLCLGGGFVTISVGTAISSAAGVAGAIGVAILSLGFMLPVAFLLARHSAEVQRGRAKSVLGRERLPVRATQMIAALFAFFFLLGLGSAIFTGEAESEEIAPRTREQAEDREPSSGALAAAEDAAAGLEERVAPLLISVRQRQADLRAIRRELTKAGDRLADAEGDARIFTRRLLVVEKREAREREREEREAERQAEEEQREFEEAEEESAELAGCDSNYEGECLTPGIGDYDCAGGSGDGPNYVYSSVSVVGEDVYGLDANSNGIGCE